MKPAMKKPEGVSKRKLPFSTESRVDIDMQIGRLASKGAFAKSGVAAIKEALKAGRTATVLEGDTIYRLHPDGTKEIIKKLERLAKAS